MPDAGPSCSGADNNLIMVFTVNDVFQSVHTMCQALDSAFCLNSFNPSRPFYRWGNRGIEGLSYLPRDTQQVTLKSMN